MRRIHSIEAVLAVCGWLLVAACTPAPSPVKVGFLAGLTGRVGDLGVAGRDGVLLAVEEANAAGGLVGRSIELLVRDDRQDADTARRAVEALAGEGVAALLGPMTSAMALACVPEAARHGLVVVSATTSTNELSGLDDIFFRIYPASAQAAVQLADHVRARMGLSGLAVVIDRGNRAHTESWYQQFRAALEQRGGSIHAVLPFTSGGEPSFRALAEQAAAAGAEGVFVLANAMDTALFCQRLRLAGSDLPVITSEWSTTEDLLQYGGAAVEGLRFLSTFDRDHPALPYRAFRDAFRARFGYAAGFASTHAYDAARLLFAALERTRGEPAALRSTLAGFTFAGVQSEIRLDRFGDAVREHVPMTVRDGAFTELPR